jgi:predicted ester cyclase
MPFCLRDSKISYLNNSFKPKSIIMKKLFFILAVVILNSLIACNSDAGGMSDTAKKNKEVNDAITKAYESGDFSKMGDYIAVDAVDHGGSTGEIKGLDNIVADMKKYHEQMPDMKMETMRTMADDEYVMTWGKMSGTVKTDGMGMKAGQKMEMTSVDVAKFKDGKAVEHWIYMDPNEMMKMMMPSQGGMPMSNPTATDAAATSTNKK